MHCIAYCGIFDSYFHSKVEYDERRESEKILQSDLENRYNAEHENRLQFEEKIVEFKETARTVKGLSKNMRPASGAAKTKKQRRLEQTRSMVENSKTMSSVLQLVLRSILFSKPIKIQQCIHDIQQYEQVTLFLEKWMWLQINCQLFSKYFFVLIWFLALLGKRNLLSSHGL